MLTLPDKCFNDFKLNYSFTALSRLNSDCAVFSAYFWRNRQTLFYNVNVSKHL
jgi:hypothetical protein